MSDLMLMVQKLQHDSKKVVDAHSRKYNLSERGLHILGKVSGGMDRPRKITEFFQFLASTTTSETDKLVAAGLLTRQVDPADRRAVVLSLTPEGRVVHREGIRLIKTWLRPRLDRLSPAERELFFSLFRRILEP